MKRFLILLLSVLTTLGGATAACAAWPANFEGKPCLLEKEATDAYYIWHDARGVHMRVTSKGEPQVFTGSIVTDGYLENIMVKSTGEKDYSRLSFEDRLKFRLTVTDKPAEIDFTIRKGSKIEFDLKLNGAEIDPDQIFIGTENWNPGDSKFSIRYDEPYNECEEEESHTTIFLGVDWFWWLSDHHHDHEHRHGRGHRPQHEPDDRPGDRPGDRP